MKVRGLISKKRIAWNICFKEKYRAERRSRITNKVDKGFRVKSCGPKEIFFFLETVAPYK